MIALVEQQPENMEPDYSRKETITFKSPADGCEMKADIYSPWQYRGEPLPLVLAPHPITWTAEEDYHGGLEGLMRGYHRGYYRLADKYGVVIVMPHGHHHREDLCSLAGPEQIADMVYLIDGLQDFGYLLDKKRVYVCGLSMGGQEALVVAGKHPERFAALFAFNPIVDLAVWQEDLAESDIPEIVEYGTADRIVNEVGGFPSEIPEAYAERSGNNYVDNLAKVPTMIYWSDQDLIVPRQLSHHSYLLYTQVKDGTATSPVAEYNHTKSHGLLDYDKLIRWQLHEYCDYDLALHWLLGHQK